PLDQLAWRPVHEPGSGSTPMKYVAAIVKPFKLDEVHEALKARRRSWFTVSENKVTVSRKGHTEIYRGAEYTVNFVPKLRIEFAVTSHQVDISSTPSAGRRDRPNRGRKLFVFGLEQAVRIRTGKAASDAPANPQAKIPAGVGSR